MAEKRFNQLLGARSTRKLVKINNTSGRQSIRRVRINHLEVVLESVANENDSNVDKISQLFVG